MTMTTTMLMRLMLMTMTAIEIAVFAVEPSSSSSSSFYTNYEHYPPYCSDPIEMMDREIPPLRDYLGTNSKHDNSNGNGNDNGNGNNNDNDNNNDSNSTTTNKSSVKLIGETRLVHVSAIIRHGARTPWSSEMKCWDGFWDSPKTGHWDCDDLTTFMAPPSRNGTAHDANTDDKAEAHFLFEKRYDALSFPKDGLTNVLNGTCEMGQLLQQGYDQQLQNGKILRKAYTFRKGDYDHDERMRLLDLSMEDYLPWQSPDQLYFRADDYQRTVMSGQVLLRGLLDPELIKKSKESGSNIVVPLHIADVDKDIVDANDNDCLRLRSIKAAAQQSPEYQTFYNSQNSKEVRQYMQSQMGMGDDASVIDCFMCTMCTDRPLHKAADDYDGTRQNWFSRMTEYGIQKYTTVMKYNNAEYAKLGIGPLWYEIMKNINLVLEEEAPAAVTVPRLALFAGHDTTLMPLLASLGPDLWNDTEWAAYASMMLIEVCYSTVHCLLATRTYVVSLYSTCSSGIYFLLLRLFCSVLFHSILTVCDLKLCSALVLQ